jgi:hypothetical protein
MGVRLASCRGRPIDASALVSPAKAASGVSRKEDPSLAAGRSQLGGANKISRFAGQQYVSEFTRAQHEARQPGIDGVDIAIASAAGRARVGSSRQKAAPSGYWGRTGVMRRCCVGHAA